MPLRNPLLAILLAVMAVAISFAWAGHAEEALPEQKVVSEHGDWRLTCQTAGDGEACALTQRLRTSEGKRFLAELGINLVKTEQGPRPVLIAVAPIGVNLQVPPRYSIDGAEAVVLGWQVCYGDVCRAFRPLSDDELAAIRAGAMLKFGFFPFGAGQGTSAEFSLKGVTSGLKALGKR